MTAKKKRKPRAKAPVEQPAELATPVVPPPTTPAPPAEKPKPVADTPSAPPATLAEFTNAPTDPLEAQAQLHRMLVLTAYDAATDVNISPRERRKELRTITSAAAKLLPDARRWEAEQLIKADRAAIEQRASEKRGAKLERLKK